uniref:Reverse transcriptase domain-containing protein n=1 Tax=Scylla olivacea TaxID=85551 RepID=A0A0N7ZBZ5_SCYOL
MLMKVMLKYKIHPKLIDLIAKVYTEDNTKIFLNDKEMCSIEITNGIQQGCNGSTVMFLMVAYYIIQKLSQSNAKFRNDACALALVFFADDGMLLVTNEDEAKQNIKLLIEVAEDCGLHLNKEKSNILIFNSNSTTENIEEIKVTHQII